MIIAERMLGKTLEPGESAVLLVNLHDGEIAEAQVPLGCPGLLIADGRKVPVPGSRPYPWGQPIRLGLEKAYWAMPPQTVRWRERLEWHLVNTTDREVFFGLRYAIYTEKEVRAMMRKWPTSIAEPSESDRLREGIRRIRDAADIARTPALSLLNRLAGIVAECDELLRKDGADTDEN